MILRGWKVILSIISNESRPVIKTEKSIGCIHRILYNHFIITVPIVKTMVWLGLVLWLDLLFIGKDQFPLWLVAVLIVQCSFGILGKFSHQGVLNTSFHLNTLWVPGGVPGLRLQAGTSTWPATEHAVRHQGSSTAETFPGSDKRHDVHLRLPRNVPSGIAKAAQKIPRYKYMKHMGADINNKHCSNPEQSSRSIWMWSLYGVAGFKSNLQDMLKNCEEYSNSSVNDIWSVTRGKSYNWCTRIKISFKCSLHCVSPDSLYPIYRLTTVSGPCSLASHI